MNGVSYIPESASTRSSNMELLRIVAMTMIVVGHFFIHGFAGSLKMTAVYRMLAPLHICGVNLFFLISGWFGIRFSFRSLVKIIGVTFFFIAVNIILLGCLGSEIEPKLIADLFLFPVSRGNYWFIMVYVALMMMSPLLNAGMAGMGKGSFNSFMVLFSFYTLYSCAVGGNYVNVNGYTIMQGIWLYLVAAWLRQKMAFTDRMPTWGWFAAFALFSIISAVGFSLTGRMSWLNYNKPNVALASICFFMMFTRMSIRSRIINIIAPAAFGCYLLQDGLFGHRLAYGWMECTFRRIVHLYPGVEGFLLTVLWLLGILVGIWAVSWLLTPIANAFGSVLGTLASGLGSLIRNSSIVKGLTQRWSGNPQADVQAKKPSD